MQVFETLIEPEELAEQFDQPSWVTVDCRFSLANPKAGRAGYEQGHVPGAVYADLETDLSGPVTKQTGRHPLPDVATFAHKLGQWGIGSETQVVAYDDLGGPMAARLWWMLRWLGHRHVAVLNGGLPGWQALGLPVTTDIPDCEPVEFVPSVRADLSAKVDEVQQLASQTDAVLLDARAAERYRGEVEPVDPVAGHVPGARSLPFKGNLDDQGRFLSLADLKRRYQAMLAGSDSKRVVHMCGSGVTACHNLLSMEAAGLAGSRLYVGSWSEWIRDERRPRATGAS